MNEWVDGWVTRLLETTELGYDGVWLELFGCFFLTCWFAFLSLYDILYREDKLHSTLLFTTRNFA